MSNKGTEELLVFTPPVVLLERYKGMWLSNSLYSIWSGLKCRILPVWIISWVECTGQCIITVPCSQSHNFRPFPNYTLKWVSHVVW
jgi:hypothetical protein